MLLKDGKNIGKWNLKEQIKCAEEIQHELERLYWMFFAKLCAICYSGV